MYSWIWRHLPGGRSTKTSLAVLLAVAVAALLLFVVFPAVSTHVELRLPAL